MTAAKALLALADGTVFEGLSLGAEGLSVGEVVFNTAMTGYQEILTDPSYAKQIINFTYPHIGNVGVNPEDDESERIHAAGLVLRELSPLVSNQRGTAPLPELLKRQGVVAVGGVDTRHLTRLLRDKGAVPGCLIAGEAAEPERAVAEARAFSGLAGLDLAQQVTGAQREWTEGGWRATGGFRQPEHQPYRVVVVDFGVKRSILRQLADRGCRLTVMPATSTAAELLRLQPDGILLSNGPGDPEPCDYAIAAIRELLASELPILGICLGYQLLSLACGARTVKMKFGHHGANHPVRDLEGGQVLITSQNHGFAVAEQELPDCLQISHRSLFDDSLQGVRHKSLPVFGFQGHPEAGPGPHDASPLFDRFVRSLEERSH